MSSSAATPALAAKPSLLRNIRKWDLVALVLNSVIGAGIFGLPARAFALAGVYSLLAYGICAVLVFLIVLCFAEVASRFKDTGGLYLFARSTFGPLIGFEIGWLAWLTRLTAFAALCNLFTDYLSYFLPATSAGFGRAIAIVAITVGLTATNIRGVRLGTIFSNVFTMGKLLPLTLLVIAGFFFVDLQRYSPQFQPGYAAFSSSVLLLVFAFTGFEIAVIPAGESRNPRQDIPYALLLGTAIVALLYTAIQSVCIGVVPDLATSQRPLADAGAQIFGPYGAAFISLGALISVMGTLNAIMLTSPRLLFAMAEQQQIPHIISATHERFKTPHIAILMTGGAMLALSLSGTFVSAAALSTVIRIVTYAVTCAALPILRRRRMQSAAFEVPGGNVVAVVALILIAWLLSSSAWLEARQALIAAIAGMALYGAYAGGRRLSR
jgi:APA family basic amino acid/polyamine antiporter